MDLLDKFGEMVDEILEEADVKMLVELPEGKIDAEIKDNMGLGPVIHFYILMNALKTAFLQFRVMLVAELEENFMDEVLKMITDEVLSVARGGN